MLIVASENHFKLVKSTVDSEPDGKCQLVASTTRGWQQHKWWQKRFFFHKGSVQDALTSMKACNLVLTSIHPIGDPIVKPRYDSIFS